MLKKHNWPPEVIPSIGLTMLYPVHGEHVPIFCCYFIGLGWVAVAPDYLNLRNYFNELCLSLKYLTVGKLAISQSIPSDFVFCDSLVPDKMEVFVVLIKLSQKPRLFEEEDVLARVSMASTVDVRGISMVLLL